MKFEDKKGTFGPKKLRKPKSRFFEIYEQKISKIDCLADLRGDSKWY